MDESPSLQTDTADGVTVVSFRDATMLDATVIQGIARELYEVVEGGGADKVVLDFDNVRFLSSQTLGVMLTLRRKAEKAGVSTAVARVRPELVRVFEITNLSTLFGFFDSVEDAAASLKRGA